MSRAVSARQQINRPNVVALRARWLEAERAWRAAVAAAGIDLYSDKAEGRMIGRGKNKTPDALRRLFDARTRALEATFFQREQGALW